MCQLQPLRRRSSSNFRFPGDACLVVKEQKTLAFPMKTNSSTLRLKAIRFNYFKIDFMIY